MNTEENVRALMDAHLEMARQAESQKGYPGAALLAAVSLICMVLVDLLREGKP
jgi:flagellar biosynthesis/type III secretory pathway ATPase